jgi:hypothetical protein
MYNYPYEFSKQQNPNSMYMNQMGDMQGMSQQPCNMPQQSFYNQMPSMPMQPIQPIQPMHSMHQAMPMAPQQQAPQPVQQPPQQSIGTVSGVTAGGQTVYGTTSGTMPTNIATVPIALEQFGEAPIFDTQYTQGYLRTQIGSRVKIEFLIGTNMLVDREGTLVDVGISFVIINEVDTDDLLLCDIYSIKFVRFYK